MRLALNNSITHIENSCESLSSSTDQTGNRITGVKDKVEELGYTSQKHEFSKIAKKNMKGLWGTMKRSNLQITGMDKREDSQTNGTDQTFNKIYNPSTLEAVAGRSCYECLGEEGCSSSGSAEYIPWVKEKTGCLGKAEDQNSTGKKQQWQALRKWSKKAQPETDENENHKGYYSRQLQSWEWRRHPS